jgi:hypothetical protein
MQRPLFMFALTLAASALSGLAMAQAATGVPTNGPLSGSTTSAAPSGSVVRQPAGTLVNATSQRDPQARIDRNVADAASPPHGPIAAASVAAQASAEHNAKAEADADLAARRMGDKGHLKIDRENLTGPAAKAQLQREGLGQPNYDHAISMGDKDHIEQVTNLRVFVDKKATGQ